MAHRRNHACRSSRPFLAPLSLFALALLLAACNQTKIAAINNDPAKYSAKDVTVAGEVLTSFGVSNQGVFELDDGTGRLWVWSNGFGVPSQGARVAVSGRVQSGIAIGGRFFANVLRETAPRKTA
jgi:hypothetical protein